MRFMDGEICPINDQTRIFPATKGMADRGLSSWQRGRCRHRIGLAIHPRRTSIIGRWDDVPLVVTMPIQTISVNRDLDVDSRSSCVANGDLARRNGGPRHGRRHDHPRWTTRNRCRNDVAIMVTVTVQAVAIDGDLDEKASRRCVTDGDLASCDGRRCRRRRWGSWNRRRRRHRIERKLAQRIRAAICWRWDDVVEVITMTAQTVSVDRDLDERSCCGCVTDRDLPWRRSSRGSRTRRRSCDRGR